MVISAVWHSKAQFSRFPSAVQRRDSAVSTGHGICYTIKTKIIWSVANFLNLCTTKGYISVLCKEVMLCHVFFEIRGSSSTVGRGEVEVVILCM